MDSGDRVRMATQLQEQLSEQSATDPNLEGTDPSLEQLSEQSAARCVVSRGGAQDGANQEAHASLVSSMAVLFICGLQATAGYEGARGHSRSRQQLSARAMQPGRPRVPTSEAGAATAGAAGAAVGAW